MTKYYFVLLLSLLLISGAVAQTTTTQVQHYTVKGVVQQVDPAKKTVVIKHEEIPGFMAAMTMPFEVSDASLLKGIKPGDTVEGKLSYTKEAASLIALSSTGAAPAPATSTAASSAQTSATASAASSATVGRALKPGDTVPAFAFTDQEGKQRKLSDYKGKAIAISFIFMRCPMPTFCPKIAQNLLGVQQELKKNAAAFPNTQILTVSIDPKYDTPAVTKAYLDKLQAEQPHWSFATAGENETRDFSRLFGFSYAGEELLISHNMRSAIIDKDGKIVKVYNGGAWRPPDFATLMVSSAQ